jgi:hypothetical protein
MDTRRRRTPVRRSLALGQAKWVPGQIAFATAPRARLPSVQPLIEAGLPYAPYIEHGSFRSGIPDVARYGRDPYRGIGDLEERGDRIETTIHSAIKDAAHPGLLAAVGAAVGAAAGAGGALTNKPLWGGVIGAVAGGAFGWWVSSRVRGVL